MLLCAGETSMNLFLSVLSSRMPCLPSHLSISTTSLVLPLDSSCSLCCFWKVVLVSCTNKLVKTNTFHFTFQLMMAGLFMFFNSCFDCSSWNTYRSTSLVTHCIHQYTNWKLCGDMESATSAPRTPGRGIHKLFLHHHQLSSMETMEILVWSGKWCLIDALEEDANIDG